MLCICNDGDDDSDDSDDSNDDDNDDDDFLYAFMIIVLF